MAQLLSVRLTETQTDGDKVTYQIPESAMSLVRLVPTENIYISINKDSNIAILYTDKEVTK